MPKRDLIKHSSHFSKANILIVALIFGAIGGVAIYRSFAATSGPITITVGGTYSGDWASSGTTPAVKIATSQPVIIENSNISTTGTARLVDAGYSGADVTVRNSTLTGPVTGSDTGFYSYGFKNIRFEHNNLNGTWGILVDSGQAGGSVFVRYNKVRNIISTSPDAAHFFQAIHNTNNVPIEVSWNEVINTFTKSKVEDNISMFDAGNAKIHDNFIQGAYPLTISGGFSGSGIMIDSAAHDNEIYNNQVVDTVNVGIGLESGYNNKAHNNRVIFDGRDDSGNLFSAANNGIVVYNYDGYPNYVNNDATYNTIGWVKADGTRNNMWFNADDGVNQADYATNTELPDPINHALEQGEYQIWQQKLASNNITIGVQPAGSGIPGDLNNDSHVTITDLSILLSNYGTNNSNADVNKDGSVNITDLSILLSHYGT